MGITSLYRATTFVLSRCLSRILTLSNMLHNLPVLFLENHGHFALDREKVDENLDAALLGVQFRAFGECPGRGVQPRKQRGARQGLRDDRVHDLRVDGDRVLPVSGLHAAAPPHEGRPDPGAEQNRPQDQLLVQPDPQQLALHPRLHPDRANLQSGLREDGVLDHRRVSVRIR